MSGKPAMLAELVMVDHGDGWAVSVAWRCTNCKKLHRVPSSPLYSFVIPCGHCGERIQIGPLPW